MYVCENNVNLFLCLFIQAPQEIVSLFSGSRQVIYGYVPHCKQVYTLYMYISMCKVYLLLILEMRKGRKGGRVRVGLVCDMSLFSSAGNTEG